MMRAPNHIFWDTPYMRHGLNLWDMVSTDWYIHYEDSHCGMTGPYAGRKPCFDHGTRRHRLLTRASCVPYTTPFPRPGISHLLDRNLLFFVFWSYSHVASTLFVLHIDCCFCLDVPLKVYNMDWRCVSPSTIFYPVVNEHGYGQSLFSSGNQL